jgi:hypothetical protein
VRLRAGERGTGTLGPLAILGGGTDGH